MLVYNHHAQNAMYCTDIYSALPIRPAAKHSSADKSWQEGPAANMLKSGKPRFCDKGLSMNNICWKGGRGQPKANIY